MFLRAARSMAAFAGMCDGGSTEDGCLAASKDDTTINALKWLHDNNYDTGKALQELVKNPIPPSYEKRWCEDDKKRFEKGYKQYGKNFFKIRRELLSDKETPELVEFYYLWKTTPSAQNIRNPPPVRRTKKSARKSKSKQSRPTEEFLDLSSASENECESEDSDTKNLSGYACHNCYTTSSKDWHHAGKERALLCTDCRLYYAKHGDPRPVDKAKTPPAFLFKNAKEETDVTSPQRRNTRRSRENTSYNKRSSSPAVPSTSELDKSRMSPSSASTSSFSSEGDKHENNSDVEKKSSRGEKRKRNEEKRDETVVKSTTDRGSKAKRSKGASTSDVSPVSSEGAELPSDKQIKSEPKDVENHLNGTTLENHPHMVSPTNPSSSQTSVITTVPNPQATSVIRQLIKAEPVDEVSSQTCSNDQAEISKDPEPKIDDTEVYHSQHAIFRRHWYRGENNSCSRTDLVFMPPPGSLMAKRREAKLMKVDGKDMKLPFRPETRLDSVPKATVRPEPTPLQQSNFWANPLSGLMGSNGGQSESSAMQRLADISRQMSDPNGFIPGTAAFNQAWATDPLLRYQLMNNIFVPEDRERFEREIREKQQQLLEQDMGLSKSLGLYPGGQMPPGAIFGDPRQWLEFQQCLEGRNHFAPHMFPNGERFAAPMPQFAGPSDPAVVERINNELLAAHRFQLERLAPVDPVARLQLDQLTAAQHHTHSHTHSHTHLHIHPGQEGPGTSKPPPPSNWPQIADPSGHFRPPGSSHRSGPTPFPPGIEFGLDPQRAALFAASGLAFPPGFPANQLDAITQERLWRHQRQQMDQSRRHFDREQFAALQQQAAADQQHREMLRRIQDEQRASNQPLPASVSKSNHS